MKGAWSNFSQWNFMLCSRNKSLQKFLNQISFKSVKFFGWYVTNFHTLYCSHLLYLTVSLILINHHSYMCSLLHQNLPNGNTSAVKFHKGYENKFKELSFESKSQKNKKQKQKKKTRKIGKGWVYYSGIFYFCQYLHIGAGTLSFGGDVFRL